MQRVGLVAVEFDVTEPDVVAFYYRSVIRLPMFEAAYRRNLRTGVLAGVAVAVALAMWGYLTARAGTNPMNRGLVLAGIYVAVWLVYAFTSLRRSAFERRTRKGIVRMVRSGSVPMTLGPARVELRPTEVFCTDRENKLGIEWANVARVEEEDGAVYFTGTGGAVIRIPPSAFTSAIERAELVREANDLRQAMARATPAP